jgi:hypothetical protein
MAQCSQETRELSFRGRRHDWGHLLTAGVNRFGGGDVLFSEDTSTQGEGNFMGHAMVPMFLFAMIAWIAWVIFSSIRRYLLAKMQLIVQMRLLEKVDTSQTLLAYVESESGRRFLDSLRVEQGEPAMPYRRILSGAQTGIILSAFGIGMLVLHSTGVAQEQEFTIFGGLALALGIGFGFASAASYLLSRSFGLLQRGSNV